MMIYVGIDDTDILDAPGTNQLARLMVRELAGQARGRMILRHQLLEDPRVPCTKKNGCASIAFEQRHSLPSSRQFSRDATANDRAWCPRAAIPGCA